MAKSLSTQSIWLIVGVGTLVLVGGFVAYSFTHLPSTTTTATATKFNLAVLDEMQATSTATKANVFEKAAQLKAIPQSQGDNVQYTQSELGKTDLSRPE